MSAAAGKLKQPDVLEKQVRRMLADPRSESLVTNFAAQWLFLRDVEVKSPDLFLFRDFDEGLRKSFERETELFLDSILRENRSVMDLLTANYTFLNERLAEHYGIPEYSRQPVPARDVSRKAVRAAACLGQGSILTLTSYSTRTSPVLRGKYVLENLLASPPPPPPPNVPSLEDRRQQIRRGSCRCAKRWCSTARIRRARVATRAWIRSASRWRTSTRSGKWRDQDAGKPIDVSSKLPDGTVVDGVAGVRKLVLRDPGAFRRCGDRETADVCNRPQCAIFRRAGDSQDRPRGRARATTSFRIAGAGCGRRAFRFRREELARRK